MIYICKNCGEKVEVESFEEIISRRKLCLVCKTIENDNRKHGECKSLRRVKSTKRKKF